MNNGCSAAPRELRGKESTLPPLSQSILNETQKIINFSNALQDLMDRIAL